MLWRLANSMALIRSMKEASPILYCPAAVKVICPVCCGGSGLSGVFDMMMCNMDSSKSYTPACACQDPDCKCVGFTAETLRRGATTKRSPRRHGDAEAHG